MWQRRLIQVPGSPLNPRIPIVLEGNYEGLAPVEPLFELFDVPYYGSPQRPEAWYQTKWGQRRASYGCTHFEAWLGDPEPRERVASVDIASTTLSTFSDPFESQCTP